MSYELLHGLSWVASRVPGVLRRRRPGDQKGSRMGIPCGPVRVPRTHLCNRVAQNLTAQSTRATMMVTRVLAGRLRVAPGTQAVSRLGECDHQDSEARPRERPNERPMPMPSESHQVSEWVPQETDASRVQQCPD